MQHVTDVISASDCYEIGKMTYNNDDYYHTTLWMEKAMNLVALEKNRTVQRMDILDYLAFSLYKVSTGMGYRISHYWLSVYKVSTNVLGQGARISFYKVSVLTLHLQSKYGANVLGLGTEYPSA